MDSKRCMEVQVGLRVVRGPNWRWGDQDGGEGYVGTVSEVQRAGRPRDCEEDKMSPCVVTVQWDCGNRCRYRCGIEDKYDLRVIDCARAGRCQDRLYLCCVRVMYGKYADLVHFLFLGLA